MTERSTGAGPRWRSVAALAGLAVAAQLWGLYRVTGPAGPGWFPHVDKLEHLLGFALPVALVVLALGLRRLAQGQRPARSTLRVVVAVAAGHAVVSELVQHTFYTGRTGDPLDALADGLGTALGALVAARLLRRAASRPPAAGAVAETAPSRAGVG